MASPLSATALLLVALSASACGGDPSGSGGGSTTTGGTGGASTGGAGSMVTSGGGGAGGGVSPEDIAVCEGLCPPGTCMGNVCVRPARVDGIAFHQGLTDIGASYSEASFVQVCQTSGYSAKIHALATDGPCAVIEVELTDGMLGNAPFDAGTLTIDAASSGTNDLMPQGDCWAFETTPDPLFVASESVTLKASGGADYPAFSVSASAPEMFDLTAQSAFTPGQDFKVSWSGGGKLDYVMIPVADRSIYCHADAVSEITVTGALTSLVSPQTATGVVVTNRRNTAAVDAGPNKKAHLSVVVTRQAEFEYQ